MNKIMLAFASLLCAGTPLVAEDYQRAVEDADNVKNKLFPKEGKVELALFDLGMILNQSYIDSLAFHGGITYHFKEAWGLSLEGLLAMNTDKPERYCIEHFYNDFFGNVAKNCPDEGESISEYLFQDGVPVPGANYGPAYVNIREISSIYSAALVWSPLYGKQLAWMSQTAYLDLFLTMGAGITNSTFYPLSETLRGTDHISRRPRTEIPQEVGCPIGDGIPGVCPGDEDGRIGSDGRPDPKIEAAPTLTLGIGWKFHFWKRWHLKTEIRNYTRFAGTVDPIFMIWGGLGLRI